MIVFCVNEQARGSIMRNKIKQIRQEKNLTIRELAAKASVAIGYLSTLENDFANTTNPTISTMQRIAAALDMPVHEVFIFDEGEREA